MVWVRYMVTLIRYPDVAWCLKKREICNPQVVQASSLNKLVSSSSLNRLCVTHVNGKYCQTGRKSQLIELRESFALHKQDKSSDAGKSLVSLNSVVFSIKLFINHHLRLTLSL